MVRSVTTFDAEWTDDDVAAALAWQEHERGLCSGCRHPKAETFSKDRANGYEAEPLACHACQARDQAQRKYRKDKGDEDGVFWVVRDRDGEV